MSFVGEETKKKQHDKSRDNVYTIMNTQIKEQWVKALRSGEYLQGEGCLRSGKEGERKFCCLGVLCDLYKKSKRRGKWVKPAEDCDRFVLPSGDESEIELPDPVVEWAGLEDQDPIINGHWLSRWNDEVVETEFKRADFHKIADMIEEYL